MHHKTNNNSLNISSKTLYDSGSLFAYKDFMKTAFTIWNGRIAPVCDVATCVIIVDEDLERRIELPQSMPEKVELLLREGVKELVCGAISRNMQHYIESHDINTIPFIAGEWNEVLLAWRNNELNQTQFAMPGCGQCRRRNRNRNHGL